MRSPGLLFLRLKATPLFTNAPLLPQVTRCIEAGPTADAAPKEMGTSARPGRPSRQNHVFNVPLLLESTRLLLHMLRVLARRQQHCDSARMAVSSSPSR